MKETRVWGGKFYVVDGDTMSLAHPILPIPVSGPVLSVTAENIVDRWSAAVRNYWSRMVRMGVIEKPPVIIRVGDSETPWGGQLNIRPKGANND